MDRFVGRRFLALPPRTLQNRKAGGIRPHEERTILLGRPLSQPARLFWITWILHLGRRDGGTSERTLSFSRSESEASTTPAMFRHSSSKPLDDRSSSTPALRTSASASDVTAGVRRDSKGRAGAASAEGGPAKRPGAAGHGVAGVQLHSAAHTFSGLRPRFNLSLVLT